MKPKTAHGDYNVLTTSSFSYQDLNVSTEAYQENLKIIQRGIKVYSNFDAKSVCDPRSFTS